MQRGAYLVGVAGGSGSGKTTLIRALRDLPEGIDLDHLAADLRTLVSGESVHRKEYTFNQPNLEPKWLEVKPAPVILVEGLFVLHHAPVRELFDLKVFVEASEDVQLQRRLSRDAAERGYGPTDVRYQWDNHVMPAYRDYLLPYRSLCDLHVINEARFDNALNVLCDHLCQRAGVQDLARVIAG